MEWPWLTESVIVYAVAISLIIDFIVDLHITYRQYLTLITSRYNELPSELKKYYSSELFEKSRDYESSNIRYDACVILNCFIVNSAYLYFFFYLTMWNSSKMLLTATGIWPSNWDEEIGISVLYYLMSILLDKMINFPFNLYYNFVIEERSGFNRTTLLGSFGDFCKDLLIQLVLFCPETAITVYVIKHTGQHFYFFYWLHLLSSDILLSYIYPSIIDPFFYDFSRLREGPVRARLEQLVNRVGFSLSEIYIRFSRTSGHSNAYFSGVFSNKRIVLYDSIFKDPADENATGENIEEIAATVAHELGHWHYLHTTKDFIIKQIRMIFWVGIFTTFYQHVPMFQAFGFRKEERPVWVAMEMIQDMFLLGNLVLSLLDGMWDRYCEKQADSYAVKLGLGEPSKSGLCKDYVDNLDFPFEDPLYHFCVGSHPTLPERIANINEAMKKPQ